MSKLFVQLSISARPFAPFAWLPAALALTVALSACTDNKNFRLRQVENGFVAATQKNSSQDLQAAKGQDSTYGPFTVTIGDDVTKPFQAAKQIDQKFDLLWVVDNSASMEPSQDKLRRGFKNFAAKYMRPNWDIHVAAITTDTYLANKAYANYLVTPNPGFSKQSNYLKTLLATLKAASPLDAIMDPATGTFHDFPTPTQMVPSWNADYARLMDGNHDGPIASVCYEGNYEHQGDYQTGKAACKVRETIASGSSTFKYSGIEHCLRPTASESSISQCVNTVLNNTVHSHNPVVATMPPAGTPGDAAWSQKLLDDFIVNVSVSTAGAGDERGLNSLEQLLDDNENRDNSKNNPLFRAGSKRMIVFLSDEEDQSIDLSKHAGEDLNPESLLYFTKDKKDNGGKEDLTCQRTLEGHTYNPGNGRCPKPEDLLPTAEVKAKLDAFFQKLDQSAGKAAATPNYAVTAIVTQKWSTLKNFIGDDGVGTQSEGARYQALVKAVGNGSLAMDIGADDYSPILEQIGKAVIEGFRTFTLTDAPADPANLIVKIVHADKSVTVVPKQSYQLAGLTVTITDDAIVDALQPTDSLTVEAPSKKLDTFPLTRAPSAAETMTVQLTHASGAPTTLAPAQYQILTVPVSPASPTGVNLKITDPNVVKTLVKTDALAISYKATRLSSFTIDHAPETGEKVVVLLVHANGAQEPLAPSQYQISGTNLKITDTKLIARFVESDNIVVHYELKLLNHFALDRTPTGKEDMTVKLVRAGGAETILEDSQYEIDGKSLVITDPAIASSLTAQDQVLVSYQPKYVYEKGK